MRVTVFDYGAGNLHSLVKALLLADAEVRIEERPAAAIDTDVLILPGVGAFGQAASRLAPARAEVRAAILAGLPTIGICLGMQLLFGSSEESPGAELAGLAVIDGTVTRLRAARVPQIGWNSLQGNDPLLATSGLRTAYFANGYVCRPADFRVVTCWSSHEEDRFPVIVRAHRAIGVQFHPEKSSRAGVGFLRAALDGVAA